MSEVAYYTEEGLKTLRDELEQLEHVERPRITQEISGKNIWNRINNVCSERGFKIYDQHW